jgi:membrane protease YdiL (CAAX protease family)
MRYALFQDSKPFGKLVMSFFLMGSCYLVIFILTLLISVPVFGMTFSEIIEMFRTGDFADHINLVSFFQITYSAGLFLIPALMAGFLFYGNSLEYLSAKKIPVPLTMMLSILVVLGAVPLINFLAEFNMNLSLPQKLSGLEDRIRETESEAEELMNLFLSDTSIPRFLVNLFMIAVVPAIGEEFFFRGIIQRIFTEWFRNHHIGIIISAILFSFMHFQFLGFIPRILLGVLFGYLLVWTGSIWVPVLAHFINNAIAVTFYFLYNRGLINGELNTIGADKESVLYTISSSIFVILIMGGIYFVEKRKANQFRDFVV